MTASTAAGESRAAVERKRKWPKRSQAERVTRARLLHDVWRLDFEPGTNSLEVHVSRLRAKLAAAGIVGLVETDPRGGYRLAGRGGAPVDLQLCA